MTKTRHGSLHFRRLDGTDRVAMLRLAAELNPKVDAATLAERLEGAMSDNSYACFGVFREAELIGMCGAWITTRLYCGKQVELDNVVVLPAERSGSIGERLLAHVLAWAESEGCVTAELNAYVTNPGAQSFYFKHGFHILGFHFQKVLARG